MNYLDDIIKVPILNKGSIYHYTSLQALQGILTNKEFWVTKSDFMNDKSELIYTSNMFEELFFKKMSDSPFKQKLINAFNKEKLDITGDYTLDISQLLSGYHILSFSTVHDNLTLWVEFSDSMGYCLKFDIKTLLENMPQKIKWHVEVIYNLKKQKQLLAESVEKALRMVDKRYTKLDDLPQDFSDDEIMSYSLFLCGICTVYSMFFKSKSFSSEKEYRIVFSEIYKIDKKFPREMDLFFREKNSALIPYVKESFGTLDSIKGITVGPKNNLDIAIKGLNYFCSLNKIKVDIRESNIPLRY